MSTTKVAPKSRRGRADRAVGVTRISTNDDGNDARLYRGYPARDLAARRTVEETAHILWHGELPTSDQLDAQNAVERSHRSPRAYLRTLIDALPPMSHPLDVIRTAVSAIGAYDSSAVDALPEVLQAKSLRLWAVLPSVLAYDWRRRRSMDFVEPRDDLSYAENILWMMFGAEPDPAVAQELTTLLILHAENSAAPSAITARTIASTQSDLYSAVAGAIGAFKGSLDSVENQEATARLDEICTTGRGRALSGTESADDQPDAGRTHRSGVSAMDLGPSVAAPLLAAAQMLGWTAHIVEQRAGKPLAWQELRYSGEERREVPDED